MPLTADRAKPAVPFAGIYRLIDFALSNVVNSGYLKVVVLTQYKSHSLDRHITQTWRMSNAARQLRRPGAGPAAGRQALVPRQRRRDLPVAQPDHATSKPDIVVVVGADHVYRMDFSQMVGPARRVRRRLHGRRDPAADRAGRPVRRDRRRPGRAQPDPRVPREADRPGRAARLPRRGARLDGQLRLRRRRPRRRRHRATRRSSGSKHDMGGDIVPCVRAPRRGRRLRLQGQRGARRRPTATAATGATSGPLASYYDAHMDLISPLPVFNLYNFDWPIYTSYGPQPPAKLVRGRARRAARRRRRRAVARRRGHRRPGLPVGALARGLRHVQGARSATRCCSTACSVGEGAVVRSAIIDKNVDGPARRPDRRRPRGGPRPRLRGRGRPDGHRQGAAVPVVTPAGQRRPAAPAGPAYASAGEATAS